MIFNLTKIETDLLRLAVEQLARNYLDEMLARQSIDDVYRTLSHKYRTALELLDKLPKYIEVSDDL